MLNIKDKLNKNFHRLLDITDSDDNIIFISLSLEELNLTEKDLINNRKTNDEVLKILYPGRI